MVAVRLTRQSAQWEEAPIPPDGLHSFDISISLPLGYKLEACDRAICIAASPPQLLVGGRVMSSLYFADNIVLGGMVPSGNTVRS